MHPGGSRLGYLSFRLARESMSSVLVPIAARAGIGRDQAGHVEHVSPSPPRGNSSDVSIHRHCARRAIGRADTLRVGGWAGGYDCACR